jgi:tRNA dimethylallyltransferase
VPPRSCPTPLIAIVGTTASGKSTLAIELALRLGGEIISADSRQVYRGLDFGTGKVTPAERQLVPHHLLDVADVRQRFTVAEYQLLAFVALDAIVARGHVPLLVGGTGLSIRAVVDNPRYPSVPPDPALRDELERQPLADLVAELRRLDPVAAERIDLHNPRRVVRALEVTRSSGRPFSAQQGPGEPRVHALQLGLDWPTPALQERIRARLHARLDASPGLVDEVRALLAAGVPASRLDELGLEYRFVPRYLEGALSYQDMVDQLARAIWQFARRQRTWFRHDPRIVWLPSPDPLPEAERLARAFLARPEAPRKSPSV